MLKENLGTQRKPMQTCRKHANSPLKGLLSYWDSTRGILAVRQNTKLSYRDTPMHTNVILITPLRISVLFKTNVQHHSQNTCCLLHSLIDTYWQTSLSGPGLSSDASILPDRLQTLSAKLLNPQRWNDPRSQVSVCIRVFLSASVATSSTAGFLTWVNIKSSQMQLSPTSSQIEFDMLHK